MSLTERGEWPVKKNLDVFESLHFLAFSSCKGNCWAVKNFQELINVDLAVSPFIYLDVCDA